MEAQPVESQATLPIAEVWLSLSQIAGLKKVTVQAISKRVERFAAEGLIEVKRDGREKKINLVVYDRLIGEHTDPAQELRNLSGIARPTTSPPAAEPDDSGANPKYSASRALRESYEAENSRLDLEERTGRRRHGRGRAAHVQHLPPGTRPLPQAAGDRCVACVQRNRRTHGDADPG
jgi:hypothetical protein